MTGPDAPELPGSTEARLPCGTEPVDLLAQVCDGRAERLTPHQQGCPHCRRVLVDDQRLWAPVDALAAEPVHAPRSIVAQALSYVRELAGDARTPVLPFAEDPAEPPDPAVAGGAWVTARVVTRRAHLVAQAVDGVRLALSHLTVTHVDLHPPDPATAEVAVDMTVAADYGQDLHALADRVRTSVVDDIRTLTGPRPVTVSVHVDDVFPAAGRPPAP